MAGETMVGFGYKQAWLAVRGGEAAAAFAALGATDEGTCSWRTGIDRCYLTDDCLVATPPVHGWLLVVGRWLLMHESDVDLETLSTRLATEVQYFASYRVTELHRWARAVDGKLVRSFRYLGREGEVTDWRGDLDDAERAIGLPARLEGDTDILVGEQDVIRVARAWSVDPMALDGQPSPGPLRAGRAPDRPI